MTDEQRSRRPIFIATLWAGASWLFFRVARSTRMIQIWALRSRLEKQPTDLRQNTSYFGDRTLTDKQRLRAGVALFPTNAHQSRLIIISTWVANAKVTYEFPSFGHLQDARNNIGFEDRNPADAHPPCTCSEPENADRHHRGIV